MYVNGSGISEIIIIPNRIKDFFPGKSNSLIFQKVSKKLKFLKAKIHRLVNEDNTKYLCWPENEDQQRSKLIFGYASDLDMDNGKGTILKQTDNCVVQQIYDRFVGMDYVECWGKFDT